MHAHTKKCTPDCDGMFCEACGDRLPMICMSCTCNRSLRFFCGWDCHDDE